MSISADLAVNSKFKIHFESTKMRKTISDEEYQNAVKEFPTVGNYPKGARVNNFQAPKEDNLRRYQQNLAWILDNRGCILLIPI